jgi:hypothetical protein
MAFNFNISFGNNKLPSYVERNSDGSFWYGIKDFFSGSINKGFKTEKQKLESVLCNPALLKVIGFRADIYSQIKFNEYKNDALLEADFLYSATESGNPNPNQTWVDFHYDVSFWRDLGNAYLYKDKDVMYCLNPLCMEIKEEQLKTINKYIFSSFSTKQAKKGTFKAKFNDSADWQTLQLENLYILSDLSTSVAGNWLGGNSRLDALYQVVQNSELSLKAKNRNLFYTTKFSVSGQHDPKDQFSTPMSNPEQQSITNGLQGNKEIYATKEKIDVKQLVTNIKSLDLDNSYLSDLTIIGNMYGLTKDVLDIMSKGSTYENKEKAIGAFIDYSMMPKVQQHSDLLEVLFDKEDIRGSFKHLPFNAVFEAEKINNTKIELENLKIAAELGLDATLVTNKLKELYGY